jgi:hypothetical protein
MELEKPIEYHQGLKGVKCPACTDTFAGERLLELLSPEMREKYALLQSKCAEKEKHEEEVAAKKPEDLSVLHESIRLQFTDGKGRFKGKMCSTCGFGPIEHFACENLKDHHQQRIAEGVHINNSCPLCNSFHSHIKYWKKWDGSFLSQDRMDAVNEVKKGHVLEFEAYCKTLEQKYKKYEDDAELVEKKFKAAVAQYQIDLDNFKNYYVNHGVRAPHIVAREMTGKKGQEKLALAREYRKAFRLWNREPKEPQQPSRNAEAWLREKRRKQKELIREKEAAMVKQIQADLKKWDAQAVAVQ